MESITSRFSTCTWCLPRYYLKIGNYSYKYPCSSEMTMEGFEAFITEKEYEKAWPIDMNSNCWSCYLYDAGRYIYWYVKNPYAGYYTQYFNLFLGAVVLICIFLLFCIALGECCKKKEEKEKSE